MLRQLAAIVPEVTNLPGDLRQVRLFRSNSLSSDRSYRSRQQPAAALRGDALRATAGRTCLCTFGASEEFITAVVLGWRAGCSISLTPAACGCAPRGAHFMRRAVPLALALTCLGGVHHGGCCGLESGLFCFAHASSLQLRSAGAHFVRRAVALALARRASEEYTTRVDQGRRTARRRRTSCSTTKNAQPQAACVSATNLMASEPWSLWFYVLQDPDAP